MPGLARRFVAQQVSGIAEALPGDNERQPWRVGFGDAFGRRARGCVQGSGCCPGGSPYQLPLDAARR
jgi:hypothetical protein